MFTFEFFIDTVQNSKKQLVNTFINDDGLKEVFYGFIDGQTAYAKSALKVMTDINARVLAENSKWCAGISPAHINKFFNVSE